MRFWKFEGGDGSCLVNLSGHHGSHAIWSVAFSPDGQTVASGAWNGIFKPSRNGFHLPFVRRNNSFLLTRTFI
jgi:hypothetical protein